MTEFIFTRDETGKPALTARELAQFDRKTSTMGQTLRVNPEVQRTAHSELSDIAWKIARSEGRTFDAAAALAHSRNPALARLSRAEILRGGTHFDVDVDALR